MLQDIYGVIRYDRGVIFEDSGNGDEVSIIFS
jgi:hypothetical protein